jgi:hypothetical protein
VAESEAEARRRGETERRRLEQEILELAGRRDTLLADVEALTRFEAEYRERMVRSLETDLSSLRTRATTAPGTKPEPSDVQIPDAVTPPAPTTNPPGPNPPPSDRANAAPDDAPNATATATEPDAPEPEVEAEASAEHGSESSNGAGEMSNNPLPGEPFGATSEVDVRTLWEQTHDKPGDTAKADTPAPEAATPSSPNAPNAPAGRAGGAGAAAPIDLASSEGVDADVLDDDAFFATLRDAVHDEKPLGPREEGDDPTGENTFFDQDADRGTFRDVFRRRR